MSLRPAGLMESRLCERDPPSSSRISRCSTVLYLRMYELSLRLQWRTGILTLPAKFRAIESESKSAVLDADHCKTNSICKCQQICCMPRQARRILWVTASSAELSFSFAQAYVFKLNPSSVAALMPACSCCVTIPSRQSHVLTVTLVRGFAVGEGRDSCWTGPGPSSRHVKAVGVGVQDEFLSTRRNRYRAPEVS